MSDGQVQLKHEAKRLPLGRAFLEVPLSCLL